MIYFKFVDPWQVSGKCPLSCTFRKFPSAGSACQRFRIPVSFCDHVREPGNASTPSPRPCHAYCTGRQAADTFLDPFSRPEFASYQSQHVKLNGPQSKSRSVGDSHVNTQPLLFRVELRVSIGHYLLNPPSPDDQDQTSDPSSLYAFHLFLQYLGMSHHDYANHGGHLSPAPLRSSQQFVVFGTG